VTRFLFSSTKIQSSHHQNCIGFINININRNLSSFWRCKDWFEAIIILFWNGECPCEALLIYAKGRGLQILSSHLCISNVMWLIPISWKSACIWQSSDQISIFLLKKTKIWSLYHQICTGTTGMGTKWIIFLIRRYKDHIGGHPPSVSIYSLSPYFRTVFIMTQNQSLHLCIDDRILWIPISMKPVQLWWCEDWIFVDENKNLVTAPPDLRRCHWYGYQMDRILNMEVQGPYQKSPTLSINV